MSCTRMVWIGGCKSKHPQASAQGRNLASREYDYGRQTTKGGNMRKFTFPVTVLAAILLTALIVTARTPQAAGSSYAEDRAAIEDLQARYLFAMDFGDPDLYVQLFTEDGILDVGSGEIKGRKAIHDTIARMPKPAAPPADSGL